MLSLPSQLTPYYIHTDELVQIKKSKLMNEESFPNTTVSESNPFLTYCDMGEEYTPKLPDHDKLISTKVGEQSLFPCHFHTREGLQITSCAEFANLAREKSKNKKCHFPENHQINTCNTPELHLYAVQAWRVFMFSPSFVGEIFDLPHTTKDPDKHVSLKVISLSPRVFDI